MALNIFLCTDLDRTLVPNGNEEASMKAYVLFNQLCQENDFHVAYVSGRSQLLMLDAIKEFKIPLPDYAITDVGTMIYEIRDGQWSLNLKWQDLLGKDWQHQNAGDILDMLGGIEEITAQEPEKQNEFKLSFYTNEDVDFQKVTAKINRCLSSRHLKMNIVSSLDVMERKGLIDILPASANKLLAIRFLIEEQSLNEDRVVFAGDSGNDYDVLISPLKGILVKNADNDLKKKLVQENRRLHQDHSIYIPEGDFLAMNGNYCAGILEGLSHYFPEIIEYLRPKTPL